MVIAFIKQSHVRKLPRPHHPDTRHLCESASHLEISAENTAENPPENHQKKLLRVFFV
jgi:hypothetical protein